MKSSLDRLYTVFAQQMAEASRDKREARAEKRVQRRQALDKQAEAVQTRFEAAMKNVNASLTKSWVGLFAGLAGSAGGMASNVTSIVVDNTLGKEAAVLDRQASYFDLDRQRRDSEAEDQQTRQGEGSQRADRAFRAAIRIAESEANRIKIV